MDYLNTLKPGKRENAFLMGYDTVDTDRTGVQSPDNPEFYIYVWDEQQQKQVAKLVKHNRFDVLG